MNSHPEQITELLAAAQTGDDAARSKAWSLIYDELHRIARSQMSKEAGPRTLQPTALINEAYLRLIGSENTKWNSRRHFFVAAAEAMRRIRIDDARKRNRKKRGGGAKPVPLEDSASPFDQDPAEALAVHEALEKLAKVDPRKAELVTLRYFGELTIDETAEALGMPPRTVDREWQFARTWLYRELSGADGLEQ